MGLQMKNCIAFAGDRGLGRRERDGGVTTSLRNGERAVDFAHSYHEEHETYLPKIYILEQSAPLELQDLLLTQV